jgi:hypothetical protein
MASTILRNVNFRQDAFDLIQGECSIRRNGGKGFSLTLNQIVLEYFEMRQPKDTAISTEILGGRPVLTIEE